MSKAMEALDRLADTIGGCTCSMCNTNREDAATLRDYITTTEAAGLVSGDVETLLDEIRKEAYTAAEFERFSSHEILAAIEKRHDTNVALLAAFIAKQEAASAARIKELEEALAKKSIEWQLCPMCLGYKNVRNIDPVTTSTWNPARICPVCGGAGVILPLSETAALSGARKVNSLGSVRGDEHLGAMLPDEAIFDARKVEP